jgi:hypothetical protein
MVTGAAPPSLARLRNAGFKFCCPGFNPAPVTSGNALTPDSAPTDDCTAPDEASFWSAGFFCLVSAESVSTPF